MRYLNSKSLYFEHQPDFYKNELSVAFCNIDNFVRCYETMFLLGSYCEEIKLLTSRLFVNPSIKNFKGFTNKNNHDTPNKIKDDLEVLLNNYVIIMNHLKDYPEWKKKFELDVGKQFAYINIQKKYPEIFEHFKQEIFFK